MSDGTKTLRLNQTSMEKISPTMFGIICALAVAAMGASALLMVQIAMR